MAYTYTDISQIYAFHNITEGNMGKRFVICIALVMVVAFAVSGCSSVPKKTKEEITGIKTRVDTLESKVGDMEAKQAYAERATQEQAVAIEDMKSVKMANTNISTKPRGGKAGARMKDIQKCLKNAGFYNGTIDGVKGKNTRKAIKDFQKANGLTADGLVGNKTWEALGKYAQAAEGSTGEESIK